jgi:ubiquinone biosynthesis protein COQ4
MRRYRGHVPTTGPQKAVLAVSSAVLGFLDPRHPERIARLGEVTAGGALAGMRDAMRESEEGRELLRERPSFKRWVRLDELGQLPAGTLGAEYAQFMRVQGLDPLSRTDVRYVDDAELAYVMQRYREVHDVWHVLLGCGDVSVATEAALKWAEWAATGLPMAAAAALAGPLRAPGQWGLAARLGPWAARSRPALRRLIAVYYERHMHRNLEEFRAELGVTTLPV